MGYDRVGASHLGMLGRDRDNPRRDGRMLRACLSVLEQPATAYEVAQRLQWERSRAKCWVHWLVRAGYVVRVGWTRVPGGFGSRHRAGQYQRVPR